MPLNIRDLMVRRPKAVSNHEPVELPRGLRYQMLVNFGARGFISRRIILKNSLKEAAPRLRQGRR